MLPQSPFFPRPFVVIGHRGAAGLEPENTCRSFARAIELDVDAVELDVHVVEDRLVVIHDHKLDRTTNGKGKIRSAKLADLRGLDAGAGERIPLLEEVIDLTAPTETPINIELKGRGTAKQVAALLDQSGRFLVSSFNHDELRAFRALRTDIAVAPLFEWWRGDGIETAKELDAVSINLGDRIATNRRVEKIRAAGFRVLVYTVNSARRARELGEMGVAGVFTDRPDVVVEAVR